MSHFAVGLAVGTLSVLCIWSAVPKIGYVRLLCAGLCLGLAIDIAGNYLP